jgi:protocatechuate 3,4-dioxygenase beta subunit
MQRRSFLKNSALCAVAVSASGFIKFDGKNYTGDCATTTDIIGPYYRPNAPLRNNLLMPDSTSDVVELSGVIKHKDCITPLKGACVEIWHCDGKGVYDNDSAEFRYRGKTYCDAKGKYSFRTALPIPYDVGNGSTRPAHYHLLISAAGYQELVTQIYFTEDPHLSEDPSSSSPAAKTRILEKQKLQNGEIGVVFNVTMMENLPADPAAIDKLTGVYIGEDEKKERREFFKRDNQLWLKDNTPTGGDPFYYTGNNTFTMYGDEVSIRFDLQTDGVTKAIASWKDKDGKTQEGVAIREK